ncbi:hypothetical protein IT568_01575 [bacterium]|nr:hypothetical protein [bacterium]
MESWQCDICGREFPSYEHIYEVYPEDRDELIRALPQVSFGNVKDILYACRSCDNQMFIRGGETFSYDKCFKITIEGGRPKVTILANRTGGVF